MNIPKTQLAYGYKEGEKKIHKFENYPVKEPGTGQVLLKVEAAGLCQSDPHLLIAGPIVSDKPEHQFVMGHEIAGQIVAVGPDLTNNKKYRIGGRFALTIANSCGDCENCRIGRDSSCTEVHSKAYGLNTDGGFQQYLLVSNLRSMLEIPDNVSYEQAAVSTDAVLTPFHCIQKVRKDLQPTTKVLVMGLGGLGLNAIQILSVYGPYIVATDVKEDVRELALNFGAREFYTDINKSDHKPESFDICFDFCGLPATVDNSQKYLKQHGKMMMVGLGRSKMILRTYELAKREIEIIYSFGGTSIEQMECMKWISEGKINPVSSFADFKNVPDYIDKLVKGQITGRVVFRPSKL